MDGVIFLHASQRTKHNNSPEMVNWNTKTTSVTTLFISHINRSLLGDWFRSFGSMVVASSVYAPSPRRARPLPQRCEDNNTHQTTLLWRALSFLVHDLIACADGTLVQADGGLQARSSLQRLLSTPQSQGVSHSAEAELRGDGGSRSEMSLEGILSPWDEWLLRGD